LKSKGQIKLEKANELLKGIPIDLVDVSKLTPEGQALVEELKTKVDKTTGKIKEAKDKVKGNDPKDVDTSKITEEAKKIEEALNSLVNSVANAVTSIFNSTPKSVSGGGKKKGKRKQLDIYFSFFLLSACTEGFGLLASSTMCSRTRAIA